MQNNPKFIHISMVYSSTGAGLSNWINWMVRMEMMNVGIMISQLIMVIQILFRIDPIWWHEFSWKIGIRSNGKKCNRSMIKNEKRAARFIFFLKSLFFFKFSKYYSIDPVANKIASICFNLTSSITVSRDRNVHVFDLIFLRLFSLMENGWW